jgi:hypothetical protein
MMAVRSFSTSSRPALRAAACGGRPRPRCDPRLGLFCMPGCPGSRSRHQEAGHALPPLWRAVTRQQSAMPDPTEGQQLRSVALQRPTVIVVEEGKTSSNEIMPAGTYSKPLLPEYLPYHPISGRSSRNARPPTNSWSLVGEVLVAYPNWMILATDGTPELSTATA